MANTQELFEVNEYGLIFKRPLDANECEQLEVMIEAFGVFVEREAKYHSLWKQYGASDSYHHVTSKAARTQFYLEGLEDDSDPIDLINYTIFLIRNVRAGRFTNTVERRGDEQWRLVERYGNSVEGWYVVLKRGDNVLKFECDEATWRALGE